MSNLRHIANKYLTAGSNRPHSWHPDTKYSLGPTLFPGTGSATKPRTADNTSVGAIILSVVWGTVCLDSCISYLYCMLCNYGCLASFFLKDKASIDLFVLFADLLGCPQLRQSIDTLRAFVLKLFIAFILLIPRILTDLKLLNQKYSLLKITAGASPELPSDISQLWQPEHRNDILYYLKYRIAEMIQSFYS